MIDCYFIFYINSTHISDGYERGVEEFIQFVQRNGNNSGVVNFRCLCINCLNERKLDVNKIREHLL